MSPSIKKGINTPVTDVLSVIAPDFSQLTGIAGGMGVGAAIFPIMTQALGYKPGQAFVNATLLTYMLARYYYGDLNAIKPAAVIGGIPLGSVDELSHGISDREVKYRANGGVFLAHQSGGNESLRVVGRAWGANRFLFLNMLDFLFLWGSSRMFDAFAETTGADFWSLQPELLWQENVPISAAVVGATADPWQEFELGARKEGKQEKHMTFPIITRQRVYLSMYIETYSWRQRIDIEGRKMVEYTIFFRKYEPLTEFDFGKVRIPAEKEGEPDKFVKVYRERAKQSSPLIYQSWKAGAEIFLTLSIGGGLTFYTDAVSLFGAQLIRNFYGIDNAEQGTIPSYIQQRWF